MDKFQTQVFEESGEIENLRGGVEYNIARTGGTLQYHVGGEQFADYADQDLGLMVFTPPTGRVRVQVDGDPVTVQWMLVRAKH